MRGGVKTLLATAVLATAGCAADSGELKIRAVADPLTKAIKPGDPLLGEARGLLALGNVGLAIEAYRKVLRAEPDSIEALAGLAECYDQMGRPDLSRAKYEAALAIAPKNPVLLRTFAASLERQGLRAEGLALRAEAESAEAEDAAELTRLASAALAPAPVRPTPAVKIAVAPAPARTATVSPPAVPAPARIARPSETAAPVNLPSVAAPTPPSIASMVSNIQWKLEDLVPHAAPEPVRTATNSPPSAPAPLKMATPQLAMPAPVSLPTVAPPRPATIASVIGAIQWKIENLVAPPAPSVTVKLPPARPSLQPTERAVAARAEKSVAQPPLVKAAARLERLSLGEVALITSGKPQWQPLFVGHSLTGSPIKFASLTPPRPGAGVRLLNAARHEGLAARTRVALNQGGWKMVTIGDADRVRQRSLVLYSPATEQAARRLAAQFGFGIARDSRPGPLTVLLGRDAVSRALARG